MKRQASNSISNSKKIKSTTEPKSKQLTLYKKNYKGGGQLDYHFPILKSAQEISKAKSVFYAGSHRHLTASLVFEKVYYIDCDQRISALFEDDAAREFVEQNKVYKNEAVYEFKLLNFQNQSALKPYINKCDMLISMSAGLVTPHCSNVVKKGGYLLVSDAHADARTAFLSHEWRLVAVWHDNQFDQTPATIARCFKVKKTGQTINQQQVEESVKIGAISKRSFKLEFEPMFFLFEKLT